MEIVWLYAFIIFVLQCFSAFFSGSETALTTASRARLHTLAQEGSKRAKTALALREHKDKLLGTILVGNNFVNTAAATVSGLLLAKVFGDAETGALLATLFMTVSLLIFSEVLPKTYAIHHASETATRIAPFMKFLVWLLAPATWGVVKLVRGIMRLIGANPDDVAISDHVEELKGAIDMHRGPDDDVAQERAMLRSILDLSNVEVKSIMTHRRQIDTIDASLTAAQVVEEALKIGHTRIPLWKDQHENVIGVLHAKALLRELQRVGGDLTKLDITRAATRPWFIPESTNLLEQLQAFQARREHFALVVDEYGVLQGIVTLEDILEEIVGDISDEKDTGMPGVIRQPGGSYLVEGSVTVRELNRQYEWKLPEDGPATMAGLVLFEARRVPEVGQTFEFHGYRFEILRRQRNQIMQLRLWPPQSAKSAGPSIPPAA
jgi:Mg2+/Co2+ transporter CorB